MHFFWSGKIAATSNHCCYVGRVRWASRARFNIWANLLITL